MNICVFDTETVSLEKPFTYNIGYTIFNTETKVKEVRRDFIVEQIWHNTPLFSTAYYADKREIYVSAMRGKKAFMEKYGYITRQMYRDFKEYKVEIGYAYNSSFDERVFLFNCDWFRCINPFDNVKVSDIRGFAHKFIVDDDYKKFCDEHGYYTESGNYSTTAEIVYRYITGNTDFIEEHTALSDAEIELEILRYCVDKGAEWDGDYKAVNSFPKDGKIFKVFLNKKEVLSEGFTKKRMNKEKTEVYLTGKGE